MAQTVSIVPRVADYAGFTLQGLPTTAERGLAHNVADAVNKRTTALIILLEILDINKRWLLHLVTVGFILEFLGINLI